MRNKSRRHPVEFIRRKLGRQSVEEYLTITELAARLKIKPKTIKNKMALGIFQKGVHYFSPSGLGPRFKWSAVVAWLEQCDGEPMRARSIPNSPIFRADKPKGLDIGE
jgi:hypothetical protein